jgi:hypothetical protein
VPKGKKLFSSLRKKILIYLLPREKIVTLLSFLRRRSVVREGD